MLENRPIMAITIGYILGIIIGLYCKISIAILYIICISLLLILKKEKTKGFKLISIKRYFRYVKIIFTYKVVIIIIISSIISNSIVLYQNVIYDKICSEFNNQEIIANVTVVSNAEEKEYVYVYKVKIDCLGEREKYTNIYMYLRVKKSLNLQLNYGDKVVIQGEFKQPSSRRNYKGFDYREYLKTLKICGIIDAKNVKQTYEKETISILEYLNMLSNKIKDIIKINFEENISSILLGVILGDTDQINETVKTNFSKSNISFVLAVSGMHIGYFIIVMKLIFNKMLGIRATKIVTVCGLLIYMIISGCSPSVVRACFTGCLVMLSGIFYRKSDVYQNISLSLLILLIYNPFLIKNISTLLTFIATIGILIKPKKLKGSIAVSVFATMAINPVVAVFFNEIPILSLIISMISGAIIAPIVMSGIIFLMLYPILELLKIKCIFVSVISYLAKILIALTEFGSNMPLNKIYVITPKLYQIILYYIIILIRKLFILCV